ncbi:MAG: polyribonucleotide nucleotidyltransferase, partial [Candidatus Fonsibacter sp.]
MFNIVKKEINWEGKNLILETGRIARQADGAVLLTSGETVILSTVVATKKTDPEVDFFPLTVSYQEKYYSSGKIPGGYFKREARPTESETLISRLIDRPIRPLFPESFRNEVQIITTVLSYEKNNDPEVLSL